MHGRFKSRRWNRASKSEKSQSKKRNKLLLNVKSFLFLITHTMKIYVFVFVKLYIIVNSRTGSRLVEDRLYPFFDTALWTMVGSRTQSILNVAYVAYCSVLVHLHGPNSVLPNLRCWQLYNARNGSTGGHCLNPHSPCICERNFVSNHQGYTTYLSLTKSIYKFSIHDTHLRVYCKEVTAVVRSPHLFFHLHSFTGQMNVLRILCLNFD